MKTQNTYTPIWIVADMAPDQLYRRLYNVCWANNLANLTLINIIGLGGLQACKSCERKYTSLQSYMDPFV